MREKAKKAIDKQLDEQIMWCVDDKEWVHITDIGGIENDTSFVGDIARDYQFPINKEKKPSKIDKLMKGKK